MRRRYHRLYAALAMTPSCDHDVDGPYCPLGRCPIRGADRASIILPPGSYFVESWRRDENDREYGVREWGLLRIGQPGDWLLTSRCGLVIATPEWRIDRRPGRSGAVIRRRAAEVNYA
jgi:hypothetical protein